MQWYFTKEQLANTPSRRCGIDADKELIYRQHAANFIQDMGQRLSVSQLCINTAIVYMHRFYVFHSLTRFHRNSIAVAAIFLAAKVEEQPRKLEHVIRVAHMCLHREAPNLDPKSEQYLEQAQDLVFNENVLLQTLGFDVAIDHPHTHVVRCCQLVKASKDLAQTSYFMASNSLHLTTMCLQYRPTVVACFCIYLACKWSSFEIPQSSKGKDWFWYVDKSVTSESLTRLTSEFLHIFDKCPSRLKKKILQQQATANQSPNMNHPSISSSPFDTEPRKVPTETNPDGSIVSFGFNRIDMPDTESNKKTNSISGRQHIDYREFRDKRERERLDLEKANANANALNSDPSKHHSHHHKQSSSSANLLNKHSYSSTSGIKPSSHSNHHSSRPDMKSFSQFMSQQRHNASNYSSGSGSNSSSNSQSRDRQRVPREAHFHGQSNDSSLDSSMNNYSQESSTVHPPEKLNPSTNNLSKSHSDQRISKQQQKDVKPNAKNVDPTLVRTSRKPEQKYEDTKKLIEKPAQPIKPRPEIIQEEFASMMLKQSHHTSKYSHQPEKSHPIVTSASSVPTAPQNLHKPLTTSTKPNQMQSVKNGGSLSSLTQISNTGDSKIDKRQKSPILPIPQASLSKHRSLFSPEKTIAKESSHSMQRLKQKVKQSPAVTKSQELSFPSSGSLPISADLPLNKQKILNNITDVISPKHRPSSLDIVADHDIKPQSHQLDNQSRKFPTNFIKQEVQENVGNRVADLTQTTKDNFVNSKNINASTLNETKRAIESIKPLDATGSVMSTSNQRHKHHNSSNGLDINIKHEYSTVDPSLDFIVKPELPDDILSGDIPTDLLFIKPEPNVNDILSFSETPIKSEKKDEVDLNSLKTERFSPLKSAQSISALLQEPLAPMPSLLLNIPDYEQQQQSFEKEKSSYMQVHHQTSSSEPPLPSTVDMSALAPSNCIGEVSLPVAAATSVTEPTASTVCTQPSVLNEKKSEHRGKSEKKKKKEKHKHKDKDKSKDKHKNKHKDKDKEKHHHDKPDREKDNKTEKSSVSSSYASSGPSGPFKISIPRDTPKFCSETTPNSLKIKIHKERPQIKIRIPINPGAATQTSSQQESSRKRERGDVIDGSNHGGPPTKKQNQLSQLQPQQQQQRPNENQNGRPNSFGSAGNNKGDRLTHT